MSESVGSADSSSGDNATLATLLRDCAYHVERDQFHPVLYQALAKLHAYTGDHASVPPSPAPPPGYHTTSASANGSSTSSTNGAKTTSNGHPPKPSAPPAPPRPESDSGSSHGAAAASAAAAGIHATPSKDSSHTTSANVSANPSADEDYLKDIKKEFKAIGKQFKKFGINLSSSAAAATGMADPQPPAETMGDEALDSLREAARQTHDNCEWCEKHFCMGCKCKQLGAGVGGPRRRQEETRGGGTSSNDTANKAAAATATATAAGSAAAANNTDASAQSSNPTKPCFHRPNNPNSNLVANGWIEQQRRSKMRIVWKDILASLVEGRRPGEETTLWIQRQITNAHGKAELEALHQIPMKWLEDVHYLDFYGDHRFSLKIYNVADEFQFRTADETSAKNWVQTLLRARDASLGKARKANHGQTPAKPTAQEARKMNPVDEWGTEGAADASSGGSSETPAPAKAAAAAAAPPSSGGGGGAPPPATGTRLSVSELRAIAHGAGINTYGMERGDLERIAQRLGHGGRTSPATATPGPATPAPSSGNSAAAEAEAAARAAAVEKSRQEAAAARSAAVAERQRLQQQQQAAAERKRQEEEAARVRQQQEAWTRQQQEAQARAAAEAKRKQEAEEAQRQWQQRQWQAQQQAQQQAWQQQQAQQAQQQAWQQQQQQAPPPPPPPPQQGPQSPVNQKYSHMAEDKTEEDEQASITRIKRAILINWALVPPNYQCLRPIHQLLISIHSSFPPAHGVASHEYFNKWKPITPDSISQSSAMGGAPDDEKLKKAVRKLRFFLHPDKLPRDLNAEQSYMCRMLWDITSDSWEEHRKQQDELDWIK